MDGTVYPEFLDMLPSAISETRQWWVRHFRDAGFEIDDARQSHAHDFLATITAHVANPDDPSVSHWQDYLQFPYLRVNTPDLKSGEVFHLYKAPNPNRPDPEGEEEEEEGVGNAPKGADPGVTIKKRQ